MYTCWLNVSTEQHSSWELPGECGTTTDESSSTGALMNGLYKHSVNIYVHLILRFWEKISISHKKAIDQRKGETLLYPSGWMGSSKYYSPSVLFHFHPVLEWSISSLDNRNLDSQRCVPQLVTYYQDQSFTHFSGQVPNEIILCTHNLTPEWYECTYKEQCLKCHMVGSWDMC